MFAALPFLLPLFGRRRREGRCRIFAFSTRVARLDEAFFARGAVPTTYGTDAARVLDHVLAYSETKRPRSVVLITDGEIDSASLRGKVAELRAHRVRVVVGRFGENAVPCADVDVRLPDPHATLTRGKPT